MSFGIAFVSWSSTPRKAAVGARCTLTRSAISLAFARVTRTSCRVQGASEAHRALQGTYGLEVSLVHHDRRVLRGLRRGRVARHERIPARRDRIFRTYFVHDRGDEALGTVWSLLDLTPYGRQEEWEDSPEDYPQTPRISGVTTTTSTGRPRDRSCGALPLDELLLSRLAGRLPPWCRCRAHELSSGFAKLRRETRVDLLGFVDQSRDRVGEGRAQLTSPKSTHERVGDRLHGVGR